jgi:hypothetical protein
MFPFFFPAVWIPRLQVWKEAKNLAGNGLRLIQDPRGDAEFGKITPASQHHSPQA